MHKFPKILGVAAIAGAAAFSISSANAFWRGGPWGGGYPSYGGYGARYGAPRLLPAASPSKRLPTSG